MSFKAIFTFFIYFFYELKRLLSKFGLSLDYACYYDTFFSNKLINNSDNILCIYLLYCIYHS